MEVPSGNVSEAPSSVPATSNLFQGYQMQIGEGESALSWQLSSGLTWRKKIWPRVAYPRSLHRWNTVEEILSYLISFESHKQWITTEVPVKPPSGTILFFNRTKTKNYRSDGYDWKTRKSNPSIREDRMKLKVCGMQLLYGCYTHCASIPSLHRRSYWLIQDPDIIMVHYLEVEGDTMPAEPLTTNVDFALQDEAELRRSLTPANWAYLTISDRNLCSILSQSNTALEIHTLAAQLRLTLDQNMTKVATLDHAIATNNSGLPFDWVKEAQTKRQRARVAPKEVSGICHDGGSGGNNTRLINIGGVGSNSGAAVSEQADENQILKALSSSPHIILCCPQNGSVSYVLLNGGSLGGGVGKGTAGTGNERGREGEVNESNQLSSSTGASDKDSSSCKGHRGPKGKARADSSGPQTDYDLSKFNNFASRLTEVDPLQGFVSLESGGGPPEIFQALRVPPGGQNLEEGEKVSGSMMDGMSGVLVEQLVGSGNQIPPQSIPLKPLVKGFSNTSYTPQNTHQTFSMPPYTSLPAATAHQPALSHRTAINSVLDGDIEGGEGEMFDLSLNLDPESLRDLLRVPLSPEVGVARETEGGRRREENATTAMESSSTLSPISQLMQSLVPPLPVGREGAGEREENVFLDGSLPSGVSHNSSGMESLTDTSTTPNASNSENYIDIHSAQSGPMDVLNTRLPRNPSLSSLHVFPEQGSPVTSSYQWEELLHRPSDTLTPSETMRHSRQTASACCAAQPRSHTNAAMSHTATASHSGTPQSLYSVPTSAYPHQLSPLSLPTTSTIGLPFLRELQQASANGSSSRSGRAADPLSYPTVSGPLPPISFQDPLDEADPCVFSGGSILRPLPGGSPSFRSPSSSHSPSFRPSSPPPSSDSNQTGVSAMDTCLLPGQPSLSRSVSPRPLSNIPEDVPMSVLLDSLNKHLVQQGAVGNFMDPPTGLSLAPSSSYRVPKSPTPSSPSIGSVSGHSTVSSLFDPGGESPSVLELCELLSESPNVRQYDFSNTTFTDTEQKQLYRAIQIIQNTFRKFKTQWQQLPRVEDRQKYAALLIENYYTRYRQLKQQQDRAARRIQHNYRMYRNRSREMNRAALFIQQMYRFHRIKRQQPDALPTIRSPPFQHITTPEN